MDRRKERPLSPNDPDRPDLVAELKAHRRSKPRSGSPRERDDNDLVVATNTGTPVSPGNFDPTLERLVAKAGVPRLTSHGLRHTAATHMVRHATDLGEIRAAADILGHSPDMLMKTYAHIMPDLRPRHARVAAHGHAQDRPTSRRRASRFDTMKRASRRPIRCVEVGDRQGPRWKRGR